MYFYTPAFTETDDEATPRFVMFAPAGTVGLAGWIEKTEAEVNADYPEVGL